jgi:hypothetical protein
MSQLEIYAKKYMASFDGNESLQEWSSRHALRFNTTVNRYVPLVVVVRDLSEYVSKNKVVAPSKTKLTVTRYHIVQNERSGGRSYFNTLLFSEFETWYSAFEAEADEDEGGDSAASRWVYHCAKKLTARTGLSSSALVPVVEAWLNTHLESQ